MALNSFQDVKNFINSVLTTNSETSGVPRAPHKDFWNTMSYNDFTTGNVLGVKDPKTGAAIPILVVGDSAHSNLILSLQGVGPLFDPGTGSIGQMPANGPPMFTAVQIKEIADWIDANCPQ